ncbi:MAG: endonuclease MutS2 [Polyangia bacterium]|jgi:DNA mismatch repair protein MutS2|nr:endonuclease MutS2 [Polyangia bacterium]
MAVVPEKTYSDLEWSRLLGRLADRCQTEGGKARALTLQPLPRAEDARRRLVLVDQGRTLRAQGTPVTFEGVGELGPLLERVERRGVLEGPEFLQIASTLEACARLRKLGRGSLGVAPELSELLASLQPLADLKSILRESFDDHGALEDGASPELMALRQRGRALREEAVKRCKSLLGDPAMERMLQDDYYTDRNQRFVLPIKAEHRSDLPGIVQGSSQSGATVFMEPEALVELNNRIKMTALDQEREEQRILEELTALVRQERLEMRSNLDSLALLDLLAAAARLADDLRCGPVEIARDRRVRLQGLRHPLMVLAGSQVVENGVELMPGATLVITGPNTGGKTVLLKTVGICALMLRAGLPPSCTGPCSLPFFETVLTDMGDDQSIDESLSTFSAHMKNVGRILEAAGPAALVLLDEVAVGTDPIQGAALARAIVEALADREALVLVTTHYAQLKELPARDPRFSNASLGFDLEELRPTYRLLSGAPGSSSALSVARRLGLPAELLERAAGLLDPAAAKLDQLISSLEQERLELQREREAIEAEQARLASARREAEEAGRLLREERARLHEKAYDEAVRELRSARDDLERVRRRLRQARSEEDARDLAQRVDRDAARLAASAPRPEGPPSRPANDADLAPGASVWVPSLGREAKVLDAGAGDQLIVQAGVVKAKVSRAELRVLTGPAPKPREAGLALGARSQPSPRRSQGVPSSAPEQEARVDQGSAAAPSEGLHPREPQTTCDLRGLRVDEAEEALARFLDRMILEGAQSALIIHGHGTGALRQTVRLVLKGTPQVRSFRPGGQGEGGDGVTVVFLR